MAMITAIWIRQSNTLSITETVDRTAGVLADDLLVGAVMTVMVMMAIVACSAGRMLMMLCHCQMQMDAKSRRQCRQDRHRHQQVTSA